MTAQTVTNRMSPAQIQRLTNLQLLTAGEAGANIVDNTTTTITLVHTTSTGAITIDYAAT